MHPVGFDRLGRPVIYSCLALAGNRSVEDNRLHMVATFEKVSLHLASHCVPAAKDGVHPSDCYQ